MKTFVFILACLLTHQAGAQLKATAYCPPFEADVLGGHINRVYPKSTSGEIKKAFPCFIETTADSTGQCAVISFPGNGLYFYPARNYFEIRENYKGKLSPALIGASRSSLFKILGYPKIKDITWDAFQTEYGTLVLYYNKAGKINKIQISSKSTETLKLCE